MENTLKETNLSLLQSFESSVKKEIKALDAALTFISRFSAELIEVEPVDVQEMQLVLKMLNEEKVKREERLQGHRMNMVRLNLTEDEY